MRDDPTVDSCASVNSALLQKRLLIFQPSSDKVFSAHPDRTPVLKGFFLGHEPLKWVPGPRRAEGIVSAQ